MFYHDKILYCGGYSAFGSQATCHSLTLLEEDAQWEQESSLVRRRGGFAMTVVRDTVYAVGGYSDMEPGSVESYTEGRGWREEPEMELPSFLDSHCSCLLYTSDAADE